MTDLHLQADEVNSPPLPFQNEPGVLANSHIALVVVARKHPILQIVVSDGRFRAALLEDCGLSSVVFFSLVSNAVLTDFDAATLAEGRFSSTLGENMQLAGPMGEASNV